MFLFQRIVITICLILPVMFCTCAGMPSDKPIDQQSWTIAVIPDTQYYVRNADDATIFTEITQWLVDHKDELNLRLVLHLGDIVDRNEIEQWNRAKKSLKLLDGKLPYILSVGNHDLGRNASDRSTMLNEYFKLSDNPLNEKIFGGCFEEGHLENAWYYFQNGDRDYVIFSLEFGPRKEVVQWADAVASEHRDKSFILVTHEFIDQESTLFSDDGMARHTTPVTKNSPYSYGIKNIGSIHCGKELWDAFVSRYSNFELIFNGHYKTFYKTGSSPKDVRHLSNSLTASYRRDTYDDGRIAHQMLFNAQWAPRGGNGWIRLLEFMPDGKTVQVKTLSPHLMRTSEDLSEAWKADADMWFSLELPEKIQAEVTDYVDVFVGTQVDHGQLHPGAAVPFGLVQLGPDTEGGGHTGYNYANTTVKGFSHTRVGGVGCSGAGGTVRIKPALGKNKKDILDKSTESGSPGFYGVNFTNGIRADLTASTRVGFHRYTFPASKERIYIHIDAGKSLSRIQDSSWTVRDSTLITGFVKAGNVCDHGYFKLYYAVRFDSPMTDWQADGKGLWCAFSAPEQKTVIQLKVGLSPVSIEQAVIEADNEIAGWDFQSARKEADSTWQTVLGKIALKHVPAELEEYRDLMYTCLYRSYLYPNNAASSIGEYRLAGDEQTVRNARDIAADYVHYSGWSSWDDFRKYSLISLMEPAIARNIARSLTEWFAGGNTPQWGDGYWPGPTVRHEFIASIVADAYFKGLTDYDTEAAYDGIKNTIFGNDQVEKPYQYYLVMRMAEALGKEAEAAEYRQKALGYQKYWCASQVDGEGNERGFFTLDGKPVPRHEVNRTNAFFYQGSLWHYRYWVPHDMNGLANLRGGRTLLADELDYYFVNAQHIPHNQPPLTYPFLFNYFGRPWRTQYWSRHFITEPVTVIHESRGKFTKPLIQPVYRKTPDGYMPTMDDDAGSMASHFVFSALGLYPTCMGDPYYVIGSPLFPEAALQLAGNKTFVIRANGTSLANKYIQSATLNGKPFVKTWIAHETICQGGLLELEMGPVPNFDWASDPGAAPPSLSAAK